MKTMKTERYEISGKKITVVGLGYIGLPTATLFAASGLKVFGYEKNEKVLKDLKEVRPIIHFQEKDLQELLQNVLKSGNLVPAEEIRTSDFFIICVPTPVSTSGDLKAADLSFVESAAKDVATVLKKGDTVILESTVPPHTTEQVMGKLLAETSELVLHEDFYVAHCPERVIPGKIIQELRENDRVIGAVTPDVAERVRSLYSVMVTKGRIYTTDLITAEMCKLVENTYRDVNIAYANELSMICYEAGIDVNELISLANHHPRVNILSPGPGVGGHCIAVDPWFIVEKFPDTANLIRTARRVNDAKPEWVARKVLDDVKARYGEKQITIGMLGLTYKADVDDFRGSPALLIAGLLKAAGHEVIACEPNSQEEEISGFTNLPLEKVIDRSDLLVVAVGHRQFRDNLESISKKPNHNFAWAQQK